MPSPAACAVLAPKEVFSVSNRYDEELPQDLTEREMREAMLSNQTMMRVMPFIGGGIAVASRPVLMSCPLEADDCRDKMTEDNTNEDRQSISAQAFQFLQFFHIGILVLERSPFSRVVDQQPLLKV